MSETRYTEEHEWLRADEDGLVTVGITDFAQNQLGDLVYVQLPSPGAELAEGDEAAVIESVKAASDIRMPLSGAVAEVNSVLADEPGIVNQAPMGAGWFFRIKPAHPDEIGRFMDQAAYDAFVAGLG